MNEPSSRRPPSDRRPARRSLVELTAVASRAVQDGLPVAPPNLAPERPRRREQAEQSEPTTAARVAEPKAANREPNARDSSAELTVKIAKEFQARALQDFSLSMNAVLDYAKGLFETRTPAGGAARDCPKPEAPVVTGLEAAAQYRAKSAELVKANVESTMDYARALASAKTPAEFIVLSSEHARRQCEFVVKQTGALKSLARSVAKPDPE
jgi:Phasin protein